MDVSPVIFSAFMNLTKLSSLPNVGRLFYTNAIIGKLVFHEFFSSLKSWMVVDGENLIEIARAIRGTYLQL